MEIAAVFDQESNRRQVAGIPVIRNLTGLAGVDAVIVTDVKDPQPAYDRMVAVLSEAKVLFPSLLRLSTRRPSKLAAAR